MKKIPPFTVLLLMAVLAVAGIAGMPLLNVQYAPAPSDRSITVSYSWSDASERIMEAEVTSRLEGVLTGIRNCSSVSSVSDRGSGKACKGQRHEPGVFYQQRGGGHRGSY